MVTRVQLIVGVLIVSPLCAQNWSMYLKDLTHSSFNSSETQLNRTNISSLQPAWSFSLASRLASAATLSNGVLFFGDWDGNFHALSAADGTELWSTFVGMAPSPDNSTCQQGIGVTSQPAVVGSTVYVGGGDSAVYALDRNNGATLWRTPLADPSTGAYMWASIVPYQSQIYAGIASLGDCPLVRGLIAKIDTANPQQPLIEYLVPPDSLGGGMWSTPAINAQSNTIFLNTGNADITDLSTANLSESMVSMDAATLQLKSYFRLPSGESDQDLDWGSSPTLFTGPNGTAMVAASGKDGVLYALRQSDMTLVWKLQLAVGCIDPEGGCGSLSTPAFDGSTLFAGAGVRDPNGFALGSVYAISPSGNIKWRRDTAGTVIAPVTVANGLLFVPTTTELEVYDIATGQFLWSDGNRGLLYSQPVVEDGTVYCTYFTGSVVAWRLPATTDILYSYSAATGWPSLAPGAIASAYGPDLTAVTIQDSSGAQFQTDILGATSGQINFVVPDAASPGQATVTATTSTGDLISGVIQISQTSPGLFSANADGNGVAAAQVLTVHADGTQSFGPVFQCGSDPGSCVASPIDMGSDTDRVFLILYGTGIKDASDLENVTCAMGDDQVLALYAGPQGDFEGLDQVNVEIPRDLAGKGEVNITLSVDGQLSNTVTINVT
ncbi:MAG TPA: PQQ-binding-like beta-propeller repeat protein [Bryobacteraceae bacterium]|nr:PQQ-binding-like beta-propeller repeat protein [Bryobacteraceae bacterium]